MASYNHLFSFTIIFLLINLTPTTGSQVALSKSRVALSHHIEKVSSVQHLLTNLSKIHTEDKSLRTCLEVINKGYRLLTNVRRQMKGVRRYDSDTSLYLQTMFSAASTYLRTCSQILKEERGQKERQFGGLLRHVDNIGNNCNLENYTLCAITRATVPKEKAKQSNIDLSVPLFFFFLFWCSVSMLLFFIGTYMIIKFCLLFLLIITIPIHIFLLSYEKLHQVGPFWAYLAQNNCYQYIIN